MRDINIKNCLSLYFLYEFTFFTQIYYESNKFYFHFTFTELMTVMCISNWSSVIMVSEMETVCFEVFLNVDVEEILRKCLGSEFQRYERM